MPSDPPSLRDVQERFYALVTAPQGVTSGLASMGLSEPELQTHINADVRMSAVDRLGIYANMYFFRILDVLRDEYSKVLAVVGDAAFNNLITDYLVACRPSHPSLRDVGRRLSSYIAGHPISGDRPWLADLARLERERSEVFDGLDASLLSMDALRQHPPESLAEITVRLIPCHVAFDVGFAVEAVWRAVDEGREFEPPLAAPHRVLVWRHEPMVYHRPVESHEAALWPLLEAGAPFGQLCEELAQLVEAEDLVPLAFRLLGGWVADGLLVSV